jgi:hypothetical protein
MSNVVIAAVKTTAANGYRVEGRDGATGHFLAADCRLCPAAAQLAAAL